MRLVVPVTIRSITDPALVKEKFIADLDSIVRVVEGQERAFALTIFDTFKALVAQQLATRRVSYDADPGAYLSTIQPKFREVESTTGGPIVEMRIRVGGPGLTDAGNAKLVVYGAMIDRSFGPYSRVVKENTTFFAGKGTNGKGRFVRLKAGRMLGPYNQPVDTQSAWRQALAKHRILDSDLGGDTQMRSHTVIQDIKTGRFVPKL